jgi:hypothetical protein
MSKGFNKEATKVTLKLFYKNTLKTKLDKGYNTETRYLIRAQGLVPQKKKTILQTHTTVFAGF